MNGGPMSTSAAPIQYASTHTRPLCVLGEWQTLKQDYLRPVKSASLFRSVYTCHSRPVQISFSDKKSNSNAFDCMRHSCVIVFADVRKGALLRPERDVDAAACGCASDAGRGGSFGGSGRLRAARASRVVLVGAQVPKAARAAAVGALVSIARGRPLLAALRAPRRVPQGEARARSLPRQLHTLLQCAPSRPVPCRPLSCHPAAELASKLLLLAAPDLLSAQFV